MPPGGQLQPLIAFSLGTVDFMNFEVPEEVDYLGGTQSLVRHKFPGGQISIQSFGAFPPDEIRWTGQLSIDPAIGALETRITALQTMRVGAAPVLLQIGNFSYQVLVHKLAMKPRQYWWIPYEIIVVPFIDPQAQQLQNPQTAPNFTTGTTGLASGGTSSVLAPNGALASAPELPPIAPSFSPNNQVVPSGIAAQTPVGSGTQQLSALNQSNSLLQGTINNAPQFPDLSASTLSNLTTFQASLVAALQQAQQNSLALQSPALLTQLQSAQAAVKTNLNGSDSGNAAFAAQAAPVLENISNQIATPVPTEALQINTVNPNLFLLAEQYYGSASYWTYIAQANGLLVPTPIGVFQNFVIPQLP
jgi:hypothetical protein